MKPLFVTRQELGRLTHGRFNPRFRPALRIDRRVLVAGPTERTHDALRTAHNLQPAAGEEGFTFLIGA